MKKSNVCAHLFLDDEVFSKSYMSHVPRVGDEIRLGGKGNEKFYSVDKVVWAFDEPESPFDRVNIGISISTF